MYLQLQTLTMILPRESIGWKKSLFTSTRGQKMKLCGKALSVSWWIESLGKSQRQKPCTCGPSALGLPKGLHSSWYTLGFVTQCPNVQCTYCSFWRGKLHFVCVNKTRWDRPRWKQTLNRLTPPLCPTKKRRKKWNLTPDTWHLTLDTWHVTPDTGHVTYDTWWGWIFSQNVSSLDETVWDLWFLEDWEEKGLANWLNWSWS